MASRLNNFEELDEDDDGWVTAEDTNEEWEEQLVYLELNDVPSIQELFAVQPDDFLRFQKKKSRVKAQPVKATHPSVTLKFHQFDSPSPVLQIGNRYFSCKWEEPTGSAMFFRKRADAKQEGDGNWSEKNKSESGHRRPCGNLKNIIPEPIIPWDKIFGSENILSRNNYEVVALADKVIKTQLLEADTKKLTKISSNRPYFARPDSFKIPQGYTATDLLAGEYKQKKTTKKRRKVHKEKRSNNS